MRILQIVHQYPPEHVGGTEFYTQTLARHLTEVGHSVAVYHPSKHTKRSEAGAITTDQGLEVLPEPLGQRSSFQVFQHTLRHERVRQNFSLLLRELKPDIIHIQHLMGIPVSLPDEIIAAGLPYVITVHDYWYGCANAQLITNYDQSICDGPSSRFGNCGRCAIFRAGLPHLEWLAPIVAPVMAYRNRRLGQVLSGAGQVIVPTNFVQQIYQQMGLPTDNMIVVPHGIEIPDRAVQETFNQQSQTTNGSLHLGYVGSVAWQKGIHNLIFAVNELPSDNVQLSIYGDLATFPDYVADLRNSARHPGIRFMGRVSRDRLWSVMADFDVLVLPTLWYEASPLTIQEAFAVGVPIVASRIGALQEMIRSGVDGELVPPGDVAALRDSLQHLQQDPTYLARLKAGILPVRTINAHVDEVVAVYQSVLAG